VSKPIKHIDYSSTHSFSNLAIDYIAKLPIFSEWQAYEPSLEGIEQAILERNNYSVDRSTLVKVLKNQYKAYEHDTIKQQIDALGNEETYTVCTAHQPNVLKAILYGFSNDNKNRSSFDLTSKNKLSLPGQSKY
jgi:hypothetical protein